MIPLRYGNILVTGGAGFLSFKLLKALGYASDYPRRFLPKRKVDTVYRRAVNPAYIRHELCWQAHHTMSEGLAKTYRSLKGGAHL